MNGKSGTTVSAINVLGDITLSQDVGSAAANGGTAQAVSTTITVAKNVTLDLNGHSLYTSANDGIQVIPAGTADAAKHTLTLKDSGTNGTGQIIHTTTQTSKEYAAITLGYCHKYTTGTTSTPQIGETGTNNEGGIGLTMLGGTVKSKVSAVTAGNNSSITIQDGCTLESDGGCGIYFGNRGPSKNGLDSSLTMTGGTVRSIGEEAAIQVSGTMTYESPDVDFKVTLDISGGTVKFTKDQSALSHEKVKVNGVETEDKSKYAGNPMAIYAASNTDLKISGTANITSTVTGVEIRAGDLEVTGGTITTTATEYTVGSKATAGKGATTYGAAIAVSQHNVQTGNTPKPISINISDGNITGANALAIANPLQYTPGQASSGEQSPVTATINGGTLTSNRKSGDTTQSGSGNAILTDKANGVVTVNGGTLKGNITVTKKATTGTGTATTDATIVVAGGTTTGKVQVVNVTEATSGGTTTTTEAEVNTTDDPTAKSSIKVTGGKITDKSSAGNYAEEGFEVAADGTVVEDSTNAWKALEESIKSAHSIDGDYGYAYMSGSKPVIVASIPSGGDSSVLKYDADNKLFGIPGGTDYGWAWVGADAAKSRYLALYTLGSSNKDITITPQNSGVKISGTGFIDRNVVTLAVSDTTDSLGVEVDATDNNLANIKGSSGKDKFIAGDRNTTLDGGEGNDVLEGNSGIDLFLYSKGQDQINNYTYDSDIVSLNGANLAPPVDFNKATYDGKKIVIKFDAANANTMTFNGASKVAILKRTDSGTDTYTYDARSAGAWNYIAHEGNGISLGAGHTSTLYNGTSTEYATINASNVTQKIRIRGNDKANYIVSSTLGGVLEGNDEGDTLNGSGATDSLTLNGGAGNDLLEGGIGYNYFIYSEGKDSISGYHDKDLINVTGRNVSFADVTVNATNTGGDETKNDLLIKFDNDNQLSISGGATLESPISIKSGRNNYAFTKNYFALNDKSITLTAAYDETDAAENKVFDGTDSPYATINAGLVGSAISIVGNANNNYIVGGTQRNSLAGGDGDDTLVGGTQGNLFYYTKGKDVIENFRTGDKLAIDADLVGDIKSGKLTNSKLTFTINKKSDDLTFRFGDNDPFGKVSLNGSNAYLTKDGVASIKSGTDSSLDLFASAKGRIDLTDTLYSGESIKAVDAGEVKNQTVTLVGGKQGGTFTYAENKKKDGFEYGGGNVTISGYEGGRDRIDLNGVASLRSFTADTDGVKLTLGDSNTISIAGAKDKEVLLRDTSRGYKKMVFTADGVVQNKKNNPTMATVSTGAGNNYSAGATIKKIFVTDVSAGTSIQAGKNNTIIDASAAGHGVSLSGGAKNDKLIGSSYGDLFIYGAGKDVVQGFGTSDSISLSDEQSAKLKSAKITASKKSIKFKFGNKDVLTIKSNDTMSGALNINGEDKIYFKNAIGSGVRTSLTSEFSGTFRTQDSKRTLSEVTYVDGSKVKKNLTFSGSSEGETLIGSDSNKKTMFKGGGGADSLVGGDSKDTFFYAKGNTGDATIAKFDFANDKIKVSSGIISKIENLGSAIKFSMTNGKSTDAAVGSFTITSKGDGKSFDASKVAIKANNTYYWFTESGSDTTKYYSASTGEEIGAGTLITTENRLKNAPSGGYVVIDLNYSTNLAKNDIVAVKATTTKPTTTTT